MSYGAIREYKDMYCEVMREDDSKYNATLLQMDKIMKKLFMIKNPIPVIDFLNALYGDNIGYDATINFSDKEIVGKALRSTSYLSLYADMYITLTEENRILEYSMEFQTIFDKEIAVRILRYSFERAVKLADFVNAKEVIKLKFPKPYLILIEEEPDVADVIRVELIFDEETSVDYKVNVLKYYNYDLEALKRENMYLLYPLQIFKLRKRLVAISKSKKSETFKRAEGEKLKLELYDIIRNTLMYIEKAYEDGKINISDFNEMNTVIENLNQYLVDNFSKDKSPIEEVRNMVKTFYDPKIRDEGEKLGKLKTLKMLMVTKFKDVPENYNKKFEEMSIVQLDQILNSIFDIQKLEEVEKFF